MILAPRSEPAVLLIERASRPGDPWSGDMGFPGGLGSRDDASSLATAQRETREEVGLELGAPAGTLPTTWIFHPARRRAVKLVPFVFEVDAPGELSLEPTEVAGAWWVPIAHLRAHRRWQLIWIRGVVPLPAPVRQWEGRRIWGLTGQMIDHLVRDARFAR